MYPYHINDPEFAEELVNSFLEICSKSPAKSSLPHIGSHEPSQDFCEESLSNTSAVRTGPLHYSPSDFPDAMPG